MAHGVEVADNGRGLLGQAFDIIRSLVKSVGECLAVVHAFLGEDLPVLDMVVQVASDVVDLAEVIVQVLHRVRVAVVNLYCALRVLAVGQLVVPCLVVLESVCAVVDVLGFLGTFDHGPHDRYQLEQVKKDRVAARAALVRLSRG